MIVVDADHIQLAKEPTIDLDAAGTDSTATQTLNVVKSKTFDIDAIDANADTVKIAARLLDRRCREIFRRHRQHGDHAGLTDAPPTTPSRRSTTPVQLKDANGVVVQISQGLALGTQTFTRVSDNVKGNADAGAGRLRPTASISRVMASRSEQRKEVPTVQSPRMASTRWAALASETKYDLVAIAPIRSNYAIRKPIWPWTLLTPAPPLRMDGLYRLDQELQSDDGGRQQPRHHRGRRSRSQGRRRRHL